MPKRHSAASRGGLLPAACAHASSQPYLTADEERALLAQAQAGDRSARDHIILSHTRMAVGAAMKFRNYGVSTDDLTHEGVIGLIAALDRFDIAQPVRFATYAGWWVKAHIQDYVFKNGACVRTPGGTSGSLKALFFRLRAERARLEGLGIMTPATIRTTLARAFSVSEDDVDAMSAHLSGPVSLNEVATEDGAERGDLLRDDADGPDVLAERAIDGDRRKTVLLDALSRLTDRERIVIAARHYTDKGATLDVLGQKFGVSKERIRQIEVGALRKLREIMSAPTGRSLAVA